MEQNYVTVTLCIFFDDRDLCFSRGTHCMSTCCRTNSSLVILPVVDFTFARRIVIFTVCISVNPYQGQAF